MAIVKLNIPSIASGVVALSELETCVKTIEEDVALYEEINFLSRTNALDFLEFHILDRMEGLPENAGTEGSLSKLRRRAENVQLQLEKTDAGMFSRIRGLIPTGHFTPSAFMEMIHTYTGHRFSDETAPGNKVGYDTLDDFINGLLAYGVFPEATLAPEPDMVFYQKTPARIVFEMIGRAQFVPGDVFVDLGAGLGQVSILANLLSGVTSKGIEYEPAYCHYAKASAMALNLANVEFIHADARRGDFSGGTVFYLYTPFKGKLLQEVLKKLQQASLKRTIRLFTYGPCSVTVAQQSWLQALNGRGDDPYKLYGFRSA